MSPEPVRVIVCGGRDFTDADLLDSALVEHWPDNGVMIHGGANGADKLAGSWALAHGIWQTVYHADWNNLGKSAGVRRNQQMLDAGADLVIAFAGGRGTAHMVRIARKAGVKVIEVSA